MRRADLFFAVLLLPMFFQIWNSWLGVLWCAPTAGSLQLLTHNRQEQLKRLLHTRAFIIYGPVLFATVFLHELGHCFATRQASGPWSL